MLGLELSIEHLLLSGILVHTTFTDKKSNSLLLGDVSSVVGINNRLSEYGSSISKIRLSAGYLKEHCRNLIPSHAIEELANLA